MAPSLPPAAMLAAFAISPAEPVAAMARIRARLDGGPVLWWWQGDIFGKRPGEIARHLLRITGIGFNRVGRLPGGMWESSMTEAGYYTDAESGAVLDSWLNPYTGQTVQPRHNRLRLRYTIEDSGVIRPSFPGVPFDGRVAAPAIVGDTVWSSERLAAQFTAQPATGAPAGGPKGLDGAPMEMTHFCASLSDVRDPALDVVPATMSHTTMWSFYPWMGLPPDSGYVLSEIIGRKINGPDEIPAPLRTRIERDHPGFLEKPDL
ncbi:MAG: DUF1838 family protein [Gammaproteobacteria bacterium]